jgi:PAS domain S-box-containing protein
MGDILIPELADALIMTCYPRGRPPIVGVAHRDASQIAALRDACLDAIRQWSITPDPARTDPNASGDDGTGDEPTVPISGLIVTLEGRLAAAGLHHVMRIPLQIDGSPNDAIWLAMEQPGRHFLPSDELLATNIAHEVERFLCNALTIEDERRAREAAERARRRIVNIHALTAALTEAALPDDVAEVMATNGARLLGANGIVVSRLSDDGSSLGLLRAEGFARQTIHRWKQQSFLSHSPAMIALTTLRPVWLRTSGEMERRSPALTEAAPEAQACAALPLVSHGRAIGSLLLSYSEAQAFDGNEQSLLIGIAQRLADALARAEQLEIERSARQRAEQLAHLQHETLGHVADGVVAADQRGPLTFVNPAAQTLLGLTNEERDNPQTPWYGQLLFQRRDGVTRSASHLLGAAALRGERTEALEWTVIRNGQPTATIEAITEPIIDAHRRRLGAVLTMRDVTADRELARQKDELFADLAHDLRTPLAAIKASIGVVLANIPESMPESLHRLLDNIDVATDRLSALLPNLLQLARLQDGHDAMQIRLVDLRAVVMRAARTIEPLATARHQSVSVYLPQHEIVVRVDPNQIERGLLNLLGNAQKYGREDGHLAVRLDVSAGEVVIAVADDGRGIPPEDQRRIFDRYEQSEASGGGASRGFGLGLAITRSIAEAHGGRVTVESSPNHGTTFRLYLPRDAWGTPKEVRP